MANSCSGFVPGPPEPPISRGTSSATSTRPSLVRARPSRPPTAVASPCRGSGARRSYIRPFVRPRDRGAAFFSSGGPRAHGSQPGTARRSPAAGRPTAPAPPRQTGGRRTREAGTLRRCVATHRGGRAASVHLRAHGTARRRGHRPTALAAIHHSTIAGNSSGRRALAPMPHPVGAARVSALACPVTSGRHERSVDGQNDRLHRLFHLPARAARLRVVRRRARNQRHQLIRRRATKAL